ncbi:MAG: dephospho-CoA kinase [Pseudomonadota bacterium]
MSRIRPFIVGLTGGIGSGKTTASQMFAELGVEVIDADLVSRNVVAPGSAALQQLVQWFGHSLLASDGSLQRPVLRQLVFSDRNIRLQVENLLHPLIRSAILDQIARSTSAWLLLAAPLLLENNAYDFVDRVLVVDADEALQVNRVVSRDNTTDTEVLRIMQSQLPRAERLARATDIIRNHGDLASLRQQVHDCYRLYGKLADERQQAINAL